MSPVTDLRTDAVATLLPALGRGKTRALGDLYELLYADLLRLARSRVRRSSEPAAIDPNSLVHESFLRFAGCMPSHLRDRDHFLCYAAQVMRSIVIDAVRHRACGRAGGGAVHVEFDEETDQVAAADDPSGAVARVHEALQELAARDARLARVVEMLYFSGLSKVEIAAALGVAVRTVARDWEKARAFLQACLR